MAQKIVIAELDIDVNALLKNTTELKAEIDRLKQAQKELTQAGETASKEFVQNAADLKTLNTAYNANVKAISDSTQAQADQANQSKLVALALNSEAQSIKEAREQNALLNRLRNETNVSTAEGKAQLEALNKKLDENNAFIKENADAYLQQKINIGNYKDSIKEAFNEMNIFNGGISGFIERSQAAGGTGNLLKDSLGGAAQGFMGLVKSSLAFIATPIGAVLAAIVLAFSLVKNAMNRSEEATNKITKIFTIFSGIVNKLLKFLEPLGEFLIDVIVLHFELVGKAADKALSIISDGLELLGFDDAAKSVKGFQNEMKNAAKDASALADAEAKLEKQQRLSQKIQLDYQKQAEKLRQVRDDENLSIQERIKANDELGAVLKKQLAEELKIAELALQVANARIKAEGSTKATLDAQAEALTTIADIQERISGQESEQLTNRVALQKEAADKAKEIRDKQIQDAIDKSRQEIDLFIAQQGFKKKSTEDEYNFNKQIYDKELADLNLRYKNGKVSKLEYETEKLNLSTDFAQKNSDLLLANAELELQALQDKNERIIENDNFLNDALLQNKQDALNRIAEAEREYQATRLENGVINEQEYNNAINAINDENSIRLQELAEEKRVADEEKRILDLELKREQDQLTFEEQLAIDLERNEIAKQQELANAEKTGADKALIDQKYANIEKDLRKQVEDSKLSLIQQGLAGAKGFFKENTLAYKALAIAEATINTYKAASLALSTYAYPVGGIFAGLAIAQGVGQVAKIASTKFEKGGIQRIGGKGHISGGTKFYGEDGTTFEAEADEGIGILNRSAFGTFMDFNNRFGSGSSNSGFFQGSGIITQGVRQEKPNLDGIIDVIASMPPPVVAVEEIQSVGNRYVSVQNNANLG
jgi:hypothetical protein